MKRGYKIGLFFALFFIIILLFFILWRRWSLQEQMTDEFAKQRVELGTDQSTENNASAVQEQNLTTTCNTICIYEDIDQKDGTVTISEEKIPGKYIDMTRSELENALYEDSKQLSLVDKEKGFLSQHLELFSSSQVKIVRIFDTTQKNSGYYIMDVNGEVWIYKEDKETLYFKTDITLEDLPENVREEVREGKYMDSEIKVYHFLESYST